MEEPRAFIAPVTAFTFINDQLSTDNQLSINNRPVSFYEDARSYLEDADDKSFDERQKETEYNAGSRSSDEIELVEIRGHRHDLEASASGSKQNKGEQAKDPNIVDWDGPDDPKNPMNWPVWKINIHIFLVSSITFIR